MGRAYAGILGPLAMGVVIARGLVHSGGMEGTLLGATISLATFAMVGVVVGTIAQTTVDEAVRSKLEQELAGSETAGEDS